MNQVSVPAGPSFEDITGGHHSITFFWLFEKVLLFSLVKMQDGTCAAGAVPRGGDPSTYICSVSIAGPAIPLVALWAHTLPTTGRLKLTGCLWTRKRKNLSNNHSLHIWSPVLSLDCGRSILCSPELLTSALCPTWGWNYGAQQSTCSCW